MDAEGILAAVAAVVRDIAQRDSTSFHNSSYIKSTPNYALNERISLPGPISSAQQALEDELTALVQRVQFLENKANTLHHALPDTPSELPLASPPLGNAINGSTTPQRKGQSRAINRKNSSSVREARVSNILAGKTFSEEEMETIRDHLDKQAEEIKSQSETIDEISRQLMKQETTIKDTLVKVENEDLTRLERELKKHAQANEAFQRALKEIGIVISSIAAGDLSKKVRVHAKEMDDEIVTFKRTINTMIDQLDAFGNEVSRVAKEVGTEGKLGGQANLPHVNGIWRDVTYNGTEPCNQISASSLTSRSQYDGHQSDRAGSRDSGGYNSCSKGRSYQADHTACSWRNRSAATNHQYNGAATRRICSSSY